MVSAAQLEARVLTYSQLETWNVAWLQLDDPPALLKMGILMAVKLNESGLFGSGRAAAVTDCR